METSGSGRRNRGGWARWLFTVAAVILVAVLAYKNLAPFGATITYRTDLTQESRNLSLPSPLESYTVTGEGPDGAVFQVTRTRMTRDKAEFQVVSPYDDLSSARVTVRYDGDPEELLLGLKRPSTGSFLYRPLHNRSLDSLTWERLESGGDTLWQKEPAYGDLDGFLADLPGLLALPGGGQGVLARYFYDIPYVPPLDLDKVNDGSSIDASLRGPHTFYVYVKDAPLELGFVKQDINFNEGPDDLVVNVCRGEDLLESLAVADDGDVSQSQRPAGSQAVALKLPDLEEGVYRIQFDCSEDVVVSDITSRQQYICLDRQVYLADNEIYNLGPGHPNIVYTNGRFLGAATMHYLNYQVVTVNEDVTLLLDEEGENVTTTLSTDVSEIRSDLSDVVLTSDGGFFAFTEESLFKPYDEQYLRYSSKTPSKTLEFIIAGYTVPSEDGPWLSNIVHFDLDSTWIDKGRLSFQLYAPGLVGSKQQLDIDSIEIVLEKE